jgi:enoyl-CoA hydratase
MARAIRSLAADEQAADEQAVDEQGGLAGWTGRVDWQGGRKARQNRRMNTGPLVIAEVRDRVGWLTLNNPSERNTLTTAMVAAIVEVMDGFEADDEVGAVVVTGAGSAFCAGADLGNLQTADRDSLGGIYEGFLRVARSPLPTLAAVNGAAVGAGMNLALGCDVRIASTRARFDTRFLQIGLHPGGGHTWMQVRTVGLQRAMAAVVFGQVLDGAEAERVGLVYRCVGDDALLEHAQAFAHGAASAPRELAIVTKRTIRDMGDVGDHDGAVDRELEPQLWSVQQPWFAERIAALKARISSKP